jgi:transketolase
MGGSADLAPSCKTRLTFEGAGDFSASNPGGRNLHFGIREHAMGAILNGLSLCKVRPYGSGFLIFSDYGRNPLRLAAIMEIPVIYVFTHDSIAVGEDGPTHQPIEHLASLRAIPGLITLRPCDANEVVEAWKVIMERRHEPVCLILTRQAVPTWTARSTPPPRASQGAYVLADARTASPTCCCWPPAARSPLRPGMRTRPRGQVAVVSMPSWECSSIIVAITRITGRAFCRRR